MFKPIQDFMIIEEYRDPAISILSPDSVSGDTFIVKAIGPGFYTDSGRLIKPDIKAGDRVAVVGKILKVPTDSKHIMVARAQDVLVVEPKSEVDPIGIPNKIVIPDKI